MLTGARKGEALKADWDQIDFERGVWTKPSAHTKQKRTEHVPLSAPALALLSAMHEDAFKEVPFLFPGDKEGKPLHDFKREWTNIRKAATIEIWKGEPEILDLINGLTSDLGRAPKFIEIDKAATKQKIKLPVGLQDVRIHDLRHTYASHLVSSGLSLEIVGRLLGHTQASTTKRYAHLADDPLREATNRMGVILETANGKGQSAEIHDINDRRKA